MAKMICLILFLVKLNIMGSLGSGEMVSTPNPSDITRFRLIVCYIKTDLDNIKSQLQELTEQHTDVKADLEIKDLKLENELLKLKLQLVQLSEKSDDLEAKNVELEQQLSAMRGELENVRQQVTTQSRELNDTKALLRNTQVSPVAFAVRVPQSTSAGFRGRLIFTRVLTNLGNSYDTSRGVFTCPVTGLYLFSYNVLSYDQRSGRSDIYAKLRVDSEYRWHAHSYNPGSDNMYMNTGGTVILECSAGSQVEVYKAGSGDVFEYYTWFTGFLIQPI